MKCIKGLGLAIMATVCAIALSSCQREESMRQPDFSNYRSVAELATLDCYYHNVGVISMDGNDVFWGFTKWGANRGWFEYRGSVAMGIDASKVTISEPDANNVVTIAIPPVEVLGTPRVDETSFSEIYTENPLFSINLREQTDALAVAQATMTKDAEDDEALREQAKEHAMRLLKEYVLNVGEALGENYTVEFVEANAESDNTEDGSAEAQGEKPVEAKPGGSSGE